MKIRPTLLTLTLILALTACTQPTVAPSATLPSPVLVEPPVVGPPVLTSTPEPTLTKRDRSHDS